MFVSRSSSLQLAGQALLHTSACCNMQANEYVWSIDLAKQCQIAVLMDMAVGLHQPPIRIGALRVLHHYGSKEEECVYEDCM